MKKSLKAFMRESLKTGEIVSAPGPDTIKDDEGKTIMLEFRILSVDEQEKIRKSYENKSVAHDGKGNPVVSNGEIVYKTDPDIFRASRHMLVESLVYPDLRDPELMKFYDCVNMTDMPNKVFTRNELEFVMQAFNAAHGIGKLNTDTQENDRDKIEEAKN